MRVQRGQILGFFDRGEYALVAEHAAHASRVAKVAVWFAFTSAACPPQAEVPICGPSTTCTDTPLVALPGGNASNAPESEATSPSCSCDAANGTEATVVHTRSGVAVILSRTCASAGMFCLATLELLSTSACSRLSA